MVSNLTVSYSGQFFTLPVPATWVVWLEHLPLKPEAKKSLSTSNFSIFQVTRSPVSFQREPTFSLDFLFFTDVLIKAFAVALDVASQI